MRRGFWVLLSLVLAVVVHLGYMLYAPSRNFEMTLKSLVKDPQRDTFSILTPAQQASLLPFATARDVVGVCFFDLRRGSIKIEGQAPQGFWNFSIFTSRGRQVYDLNDTQVETNRFVVELQSAPGLLKQILGNAEGGEAATLGDAGWKVQMNDRQGLAILWTPLRDALLRGGVEDVIRKSTCKTQS
jgi:uncharacterized membrane protein